MLAAMLFIVASMLMTTTKLSTCWQLPDDVSDRRLLETIQLQSRSTYCTEVSGKCFSTGQCCDGLICAAVDDYYGQQPEVPGYCVKEKDLQVCTSSSDCADGSKCASLGRTGERYCLPRPGDNGNRRHAKVASAPAAAAAGIKIKGGLGAECRSDSDCLSFTEAKNEKLCCQNVRRGRQGTRRVCDRVTAISQCIT